MGLLDAPPVSVATADGRYCRAVGRSNGSDDTAALNAALNAARVAGRGVVRGLPGETYLLTAPLVVGSRTTLDMTGCKLQVKPGTTPFTPLRNYAADNARTLTDVATTSGSTTITSSSAAFTSADVGKAVLLWNAGPASPPSNLRTTIASVANATTAVLATAAAQTIAATQASIGTRDVDIVVQGGEWARGSVDGAGMNQMNLYFRRFDGLTVRDLTITSLVGKYGINPADGTGFTAQNIRFDAYSDGIHPQGPLDGAVITNIRGRAGDDLVSLTPKDWAQYRDSFGDIRNVTIEDVHADLLGVGAATGESQYGLAVKILGGAGVRCEHVHVSKVSTYQPTAQHAVVVGDDPGDPSTTGGYVDDVSIDRVYVPFVTGAFKPVYLVGSNIRRVRVSGVHCDTTVTPDALAVFVAAGAVVDSLSVRDTVVGQVGGSNSSVVRVDGQVNNLFINGITGTKIGYALLVHSAAAVVSRATITNIAVATCTGMVQVDSSSGSLPRLSINNIQAGSAYWAIGDIACPIKVLATNVAMNPDGGIFYLNGAAVLLVANGCDFNGKGVAAGGAGALRSRSFGLEIDLAALKGAQPGDMVTNLNSGLACGAGPVTFTGTQWIHTATGNAYTPTA